jgi:hypothetical protein
LIPNTSKKKKKKKGKEMAAYCISSSLALPLVSVPEAKTPLTLNCRRTKVRPAREKPNQTLSQSVKSEVMANRSSSEVGDKATLQGRN